MAGIDIAVVRPLSRAESRNMKPIAKTIVLMIAAARAAWYRALFMTSAYFEIVPSARGGEQTQIRTTGNSHLVRILRDQWLGQTVDILERLLELNHRRAASAQSRISTSTRRLEAPVPGLGRVRVARSDIVNRDLHLRSPQDRSGRK